MCDPLIISQGQLFDFGDLPRTEVFTQKYLEALHDRFYQRPARVFYFLLLFPFTNIAIQLNVFISLRRLDFGVAVELKSVSLPRGKQRAAIGFLFIAPTFG